MSRRPGDGEAQASPSASPPSASAGAQRKPARAEARAKAVSVAMRMLAARERSETEIRGALARRNIDPDLIAEVLTDLRDKGLVSDRRFAESFAEEAASRRGYGAAAIRARLRRRGVDGETAAAAAASTPEEEEHRARAFAFRRARALAAHPPEVRARRIAAALARRGYPAELCLRVAAEVSGRQGD